MEREYYLTLCKYNSTYDSWVVCDEQGLFIDKLYTRDEAVKIDKEMERDTKGLYGVVLTNIYDEIKRLNEREDYKTANQLRAKYKIK